MKKEKWNHPNGDQRFRGGKTELEHKNGTHRNRFANRAARVAWQQDNQATNATFPG